MRFVFECNGHFTEIVEAPTADNAIPILRERLIQKGMDVVESPVPGSCGGTTNLSAAILNRARQDYDYKTITCNGFGGGSIAGQER